GVGRAGAARSPDRQRPRAPPLHRDVHCQPGRHDRRRVAGSEHTLAGMTLPALPGDAERAAGLRRMKLLALSLLLTAAVLFLIARANHDNGAAWGYLQAFSEAAMVGALADWFAVTALFRHPLGIPIPHTAIIPTRKDSLARSLGEFVESNFMSKAVLE